jgi:hypothetical protein
MLCYVMLWCPFYAPISAVNSWGWWLHATSASGRRAPATEHIWYSTLNFRFSSPPPLRALPNSFFLRACFCCLQLRSCARNSAPIPVRKTPGRYLLLLRTRLSQKSPVIIRTGSHPPVQTAFATLLDFALIITQTLILTLTLAP